jgi:hypothetical protein
MAMSAAGLKAAIVAELGPAEDTAKLEDFAEKLATAIVDYIVANATATLPAASVVTTGSAATQTGPAAPVLLAIT